MTSPSMFEHVMKYMMTGLVGWFSTYSEWLVLSYPDFVAIRQSNMAVENPHL